MDINKIINEEINNINLIKEFDTSKDYVDTRTGKSYTGEQVKQWIDWFKTARRISKHERANALSLFNSMGIDKKDYTKERKVNTNKMKLKKDGYGSYYAEDTVGDYRVRFEISEGNYKGQWCYVWYVLPTDKIKKFVENGTLDNADEWYYMTSNENNDCVEMSVRHIGANLDAEALNAINYYETDILH